MNKTMSKSFNIPIGRNVSAQTTVFFTPDSNKIRIRALFHFHDDGARNPKDIPHDHIISRVRYVASILSNEIMWEECPATKMGMKIIHFNEYVEALRRKKSTHERE